MIGLSKKIQSEMKFTGDLINEIRKEIDRMTKQNKLLYDEIKKTNKKITEIDKRIAKL